MTYDRTSEWRCFVERKIEKSEQHMLRLIMEAVGEALGKERKHRIALEAKLAQLEVELARLRVAQERGAKRLKVVPPAMIA